MSKCSEMHPALVSITTHYHCRHRHRASGTSDCALIQGMPHLPEPSEAGSSFCGDVTLTTTHHSQAQLFLLPSASLRQGVVPSVGIKGVKELKWLFGYLLL